MAKTDTAHVARAQKALREFRTMQPRLTAYARAVTGRRDLRIEATAEAPHTDGRDIFFRPPIALADDIKHDRKSCDKRDPDTLKQRCAACAVREEILVTMYHEIAHVAYHSFAPFTDNDRKQAILKGISLKGDAYGQAMNAKLNAFQKANLGNTYMALAQAISEFLPDLVNITEDIRIDEKMYAARKGIRRMREGRARRAFTEGVEGPDGVMRLWKDTPLNSQFVVAMYAKAAGFEMNGFFHPMVLAAYESTTLTDLCGAAKVARSASDAFNIAFDVLVEAKKLGFFAEEADPPPEQQPDPEDQQSEEKQDSTVSSPDNEPDNDEQSSEQEQGETSEEEDDESQSGGGSAESEQDDSGDDPKDNGEAGSGREEGEGASGEPEEEGNDTSGSAPDSGDDSDPEPAEQEDASADDNSGDSEGDGTNESGDAHDEGADPEGTGGSVQSGEQETVGGEEVDDSPEDSSGGNDPQDSDDQNDGDGDGGTDPSDSDGESESGSSTGSPSEAPASKGDSSRQKESPEEESSDVENTGEAGSEAEPAPEPESTDPADDSGDTEPVDSGEYEEDGAYEDDSPVMGGSGEISEYLEAVTGHHGDHESEPLPGVSVADGKAMARAILAGAYFEKPPQHVSSVNVRRYDKPSRYYEDAWRGQNGGYIEAPPGYRGGYPTAALKRVGIRCDTNVDESVLGPALQQTRRAFNDNARAKHQRNLKSGRVNGPSLAKRAPFDDPRMFKKTVLPGKKSYSVLIGIDISGSTVGKNIVLAKRAAKAQAELCQRAGIDFAVYAHTADGDDGGDLSLEIYEIKNFREQWNDKAKLSLDNIGSFAHNLDGHTIEYYRNLISREQTTNKIILYYTDGKMPAANYREELEVLQDQIKHCKRQGIELMGVGIRTDSPTQHGLDTVRVDNDSDLVKVIAHLEKKLVNR